MPVSQMTVGQMFIGKMFVGLDRRPADRKQFIY